ncbi:hypothetical protein AQUCO_04700079v1 [Aquilegia coerulea]|uniref:Pentacotripeptide-repeat region of PRORP domain-containing protein n=1 Tax=Aquilegia coerulea TaxID=218851 RepID=A0A2G5CL25_AQUCA|nr:hypothetical protein AQUCO_04700079v1 [Aquilegia coerulea]
MHWSGVKPNQFTYGSVLRVCTSLMCFELGMYYCQAKGIFSENFFAQSVLVDLHSKCGQMEDARRLFGVNQIHGFVARLGFESHGVVIGSLINAYAKCGSVRSARLLYDSMQEKDLISYTTMITGYACEALSNALIDMYAKSGETEDAHCAFDEMEGNKNVDTWTSLITGYAKHGCREKAIALFEKTEETGVKPLSVLFACSYTGMTDKGREYFGSMINVYNISPRAEHYAFNYIVLASIYSEAGLWEEPGKIRKAIVHRKMKKERGCSLL